MTTLICFSHPYDVNCYRTFAILLLLLSTAGAASRELAAQEVKVGGLAYLDYYYTLSSPDEDLEDLHGFTYRRLYLTTDFILSNDFAGRVRFEASESTSGSSGPVPFVKDLYLAWNYAGAHTLTFGVSSPEAFEDAEEVWGYRSLEKTTMDFFDVVSSRDFGVKATGPLGAGWLEYVLMVGNNEGSRTEDDRYKRIYGMLKAYPAEHLVFTAGADYAAYEDPLDNSVRVSGFGGYVSDGFQGGIEAYWTRLNAKTALVPDTDGAGVSVFGSVKLADEWEVVGRVDRAKLVVPEEDRYETLLLAGVTYAAHARVRIIPNVIMTRRDEVDESNLLGRVTLEFHF